MGNVVQPAVSSNYVMPSYNVVQQPAVSSVFNVIEEPKISSNYVTGTTSNYVRPAASVATYSNAVAAPSYLYVQPQATSVFNAIDTNHDGKISRSEFANFIGQPLATTYAPSPAAAYTQ